MRRIRKSKSLLLFFEHSAVDVDTEEFIGFFKDDYIVTSRGFVLYAKGEYILFEQYGWWM